MINFAHLNWFDYCLFVIVFLSFLFGIKRGFLKEIISLVSWLAAFFIAILFTENLAVYFSQYIKTEFLANITSFFALFIATLIVGAIINYIVTQLVQKTGMSLTDRFFGAIFGFLRGLMIVLLVVFIISSTKFQEAEWYQKSQLTFTLQGVSSWVQDHAMKVAKTVKGE